MNRSFGIRILSLALVLATLFAVASAQDTIVYKWGGRIYIEDRSVGRIVYNATDYASGGSGEQVAINLALSTYSQGGPVDITPGTYDTTGTINQPYDVGVYGDQLNTVIINAHFNNAPIWKMGDTGSTGSLAFLKQITLQRDAGHRAQNGNVGLQVANAGYFPSGSFLASHWEPCVISEVVSQYCDKPLQIGSAGTRVSQPLHFDHCQFGAWDDHCTYSVDDENCVQLRFTDTSFWGASGAGSALLYSNGDTNDIWLEHCYFAPAAVAYGYTAGSYNILADHIMVLRAEDNQFENGEIANILIKEGIDIDISHNNLGYWGLPPVQIALLPLNGDIRNVRIVGNEITPGNSADAYASWTIIAATGINININGQHNLGTPGNQIKGLLIADNNIDVPGIAGIELINTIDASVTGNTIVSSHATDSQNGIFAHATSSGALKNLNVAHNAIDLTGSTGSAWGVQLSNAGYMTSAGSVSDNSIVGTTNTVNGSPANYAIHDNRATA